MNLRRHNSVGNSDGSFPIGKNILGRVRKHVAENLYKVHIDSHPASAVPTSSKEPWLRAFCSGHKLTEEGARLVLSHPHVAQLLADHMSCPVPSSNVCTIFILLVG